jgi:hypothetical protein
MDLAQGGRDAGTLTQSRQDACTTTDPLRLSICPACGYSLTGLANEGVCPECGRAYDQRMVVLYGWGRGTHATATSAPPWVAVGLLALQSVGVLNVVLSPGSSSGERAGWLVVWLGLIAWILWQRRRTPDLPGLVQVHLSDAGCVQLEDPRRGTGEVTPWGRIKESLVEEINSGRYRVRLRRSIRWWKLRTLDPVDAEVSCSAEQAGAVRERIRVWRSAGAG